LCYNSMEFMPSETSKNFISHLLSSALSKLKLTSQLDVLDITVPPNPEFGDYSTNAALMLAKKLSAGGGSASGGKGKISPKEAADKIIEEINKIDLEGKLDGITERGGFINFKLSQKFLLDNLAEIIGQADSYGSSSTGGDKTVIVEYFQNNVAKPPHVGHLRSAVIGDSILRIFRFLGYHAISDTHIGDWGTQFGVLLLAYKTMGKKSAVEKDPINELNKLYVEMNGRIEKDPFLHEQAKAEFAKFEKGDVENRKLWQWFVMESVADFERYRELLGLLRFDHNLGESFYEDKMPAVLEELRTKGLLAESQGAQIVNLEDKNLGVAVLIKSDGATTYLLRDLATIKFRIGQLHFYKALYVVDNRQSHHFEQLFEIAFRAGWLLGDSPICRHVDFGFMSLPEGAISTRKGNTISLQNLVDEAQKRAEKIIEEKNPGLENKKAVAKEVALAAIKYFDLSHNRKTEIVFTWDKALSFEGNTGPYLQYTHARIHGILRKLGSGVVAQFIGPSEPDKSGNYSGQELSVLRKLIQFPEVLTQAASDYLPNLLCNYLFELSQSFNSFYQEVPVLQEKDDQLRTFRLNLITATAQVLKNGLYLLGIEAPEEM
jgi:arginyl-tRNA synthetase